MAYFSGVTPLMVLKYSERKFLIIMTNSKKMDSFRELFKIKEIVPFYCQDIFSPLLYVVNNKHLFTKNLEVHNHDTRSANNFHPPTTNSTKYQKETHYAEIKTSFIFLLT